MFKQIQNFFNNLYEKFTNKKKKKKKKKRHQPISDVFWIWVILLIVFIVIIIAGVVFIIARIGYSNMKEEKQIRDVKKATTRDVHGKIQYDKL